MSLSIILIWKIKAAAELLAAAKNPGMFIGWGCRDATDSCIKIAELLESLFQRRFRDSVFFRHLIRFILEWGSDRVLCHAQKNAFIDCDCLLAVGTRFAEIPTGSFGVKVPKNLIHIDINPDVFNNNYPARIAIEEIRVWLLTIFFNIWTLQN